MRLIKDATLAVDEDDNNLYCTIKDHNEQGET